ncbi:hypothetical protein OIU84_010290 [Salix udensis]|uniref:Uncharacterized protein n=1 Tax=Salix udensis TaxID=889485 RepID=A0AAD6JKE6_9ROSI|nr:hypothetical protein OIU84_010290 [Salix udensis]
MGDGQSAFPNAKACDTARLAILEEASKQKSSVGNALGPLFQNDYGGGSPDGQDGTFRVFCSLLKEYRGHLINFDRFFREVK